MAWRFSDCLLVVLAASSCRLVKETHSYLISSPSRRLKFFHRRHQLYDANGIRSSGMLTATSSDKKWTSSSPNSLTSLDAEAAENENNEQQVEIMDDEQFLYNAKRFQTRAALLQAILKEKMRELHLAEQKLQVLQDVVAKVKTTSLNFSANAAKYEALYEQESQQRQQQQEQAQMELKAAIQKYQRELEEAMSTLKREQKEAEQQQQELEQLYEKKQQEARQQIKALQNEVLELDASLEQAQQERINNELLERKLEAERQQQNMLLQDELKRQQIKNDAVRTQLETQLDQALAERNDARDALKRIEQQQQQQQDEKNDANVTGNAEEDVKERMEIAAASVASAERREKAALQELQLARDALLRLEQQQLKLEQDLKASQTQLQELLILKEEKDETRTSQATSSSEEEVKKVLQQQDEIALLSEQLRALKLTHVAQLNSERKRFKEELENAQEEYETKLVQLKQRKSAASTGKENNNSNNSIQHASSPAGRLWQRLKRPFQRRR